MFIAALVGCAPAPDDLTDIAPPPQPPPVVDSSDAASALPAPRSLLPLEPRSIAYTLEPADGPAKSATVKIERIDDPKFPWRRHTADNRIEHIAIASGGSIIIGAVEDLKHNALTRYDPPLPLLPVALKRGQSLTYKMQLNVVDRRDHSQQRDKGACSITLVYEGDEPIDTPAGRFDAARVRSTIIARLSLAQVHTASVQWYAPGIGLVAEESSETVQSLVGWKTRLSLRLAEQPD